MSHWNLKTESLKKYHEEVLQKYNNVYFVIKTSVRYKNQQCVVFFKSELSKGDVFLELVDTSLNPDINRTLYRHPYNEFWASEYETVENTTDKYYVPVEELHTVPTKEVISQVVEVKKKISFDLNPNRSTTAKTEVSYQPEILDQPASFLTVRDLVAIIHRRPVSKNQELNDFLKNV
jgi:hypothetical protein